MNIIATIKKMVMAMALSAMGLFLGSASELGWIGGTVFSFGEIEEAEGMVQHRFLLRNNSSQAFCITAVTTSCGCTTAEYPREAIEPGDTVAVVVTFNPEGRRGKFRQRIQVHTTSDSGMNSLFVKGYVNPSGEGKNNDNESN